MVISSISYPLQIENGTLKVSSGSEVVRDAIFNILETQPLERVMQPLLGTRNFVFNSYRDLDIVLENVRQSLETNLSYVNFDITGGIDDNGEATVTIKYSFNDSDIPEAKITYRVLT